MGFITGLLKFIVYAVIAIALLVGGVLIAARFNDGPWALISGGPFTSGELVTSEPNWSFVKDTQEVQFQLLATDTSRTSWIMEHNGRVFIPSGYMNTTVGKIWKHWPFDAEEDGRIILRIDDKLYERTMQRVTDDPDLPAVLGEISRKYFGGEPVPMNQVTSGNLWIFELLPRA